MTARLSPGLTLTQQPGFVRVEGLRPGRSTREWRPRRVLDGRLPVTRVRIPARWEPLGAGLPCTYTVMTGIGGIDVWFALDNGAHAFTVDVPGWVTATRICLTDEAGRVLLTALERYGIRGGDTYTVLLHDGGPAVRDPQT